KKQKPRKPKRKDTEIPQSSGPTELIADEDANEENVPTHSNDPLLSGEDSLKLNDLMEICTKLQQRVLDLENTKTAQAQEISSLKMRVKRLEKKGGSRTHKLKRLFKVGRFAQVVSSEEEGLGDQEDASKQGRKITDIDQDAEVTLVDETQGRYDDAQMFDADVFYGEEVFAGQDVAEKEVSTADPVTTTGELVTTASVEVSVATTTITTAITEVEITLAYALAELKQEPMASTPITSSNDKGKGIMVKEPLKMKKRYQLLFDEQEAIRLQAQFDKEERIAREKEEATAAYGMIFRIRRKFFAAKRAEEKRNRPPTRAQQKSIMCTYLKNMEGNKVKDLKKLSFDSIQKMFDIAFKRVNTFVDFRTELVEGTKREEKSKMKELMEVVSNEEGIAIDAIPLSNKPPSIVDYKIIKGKIGYFQIIRADGNLKRYSSMIQMLKSFDREDLETLRRLVKAKHGKTRPEEEYERVLWGDLKTMFEPDVESLVWRNLQGHKVIVWKLFDSCRVYFVRFSNLHIFMLVVKGYPLIKATISKMLNKKLQVDQ
ncbi:hypothetical protein Tco_0255759, partial [Tanacetum coccineum]